MKTMLAKLIAFAAMKHEDQFDKGGAPYILHPLRVMSFLKTDDEDLMAIAICHDVIEDTDATYDDLRGLGATSRVIAGVKAMTKVPGETFAEYKDKVKANPDAVKVKMADLRHNTDIRRLKGVTEKDIKRIEKYHAFYLELKDLV
jgi:(p)ppGpp synthase/HD superfamily hydrolase